MERDTLNASHGQLIQRCKYISVLAVSCIAFASTVHAQSARPQVSSTTAFSALRVGLQPVAKCVELFDYSTSRADTSVAASVPDSLDTADDSIDATAMLPGSGMVLVDAHGHVIAPSDIRTTADPSARATCCTGSPLFYGGAPVDIRDASDQTARSGSSARERCVDAMTPPPSSRSPL